MSEPTPKIAYMKRQTAIRAQVRKKKNTCGKPLQVHNQALNSYRDRGRGNEPRLGFTQTLYPERTWRGGQGGVIKNIDTKQLLIQPSENAKTGRRG